jgi:2'-5' RNA ligase
MRAFLAVPVGPPAHALIAAELVRLRDRVAGVRWVDPATVHVTLHFFAELPENRMRTVVDAVGAVATAEPPFALALGDLGSFPAGSRARVLWRGLAEASADLERLAARVRAAVAACDFEINPRPFRAHVTLGRPGSGFDDQAWQHEARQSPAAAAFSADRVILYESRGGRHHVRETRLLAADQAVVR